MSSTDFPEAALQSFFPLPSGDKQYTLDFIDSTGAVVLNISDNLIKVGITEKTTAEHKYIIRNYHLLPVEFLLVNSVELASWLSKEAGKSLNAAATPTDKKTTPTSSQIDKIANDAPTVNLVNSICIEAIKMNASDIHIESGLDKTIVRYRIDGLLQTVRTLDIDSFSAISSRIKIMANLNILEKRLPQDGRITVAIGDDKIDFRISIIPITGGESIVMRLLGRSISITGLANLGFSPKQLADIRSMIQIPHGLILVTGPTGSGKTTTLNAIMKELVSDEIKIISIEDPVEFIVDGVNQIQINEQINLGFDSILRRVLRQDPNVIMVGEIRDKETAELAVRAALTGHLVLSTLHTNDAISVITRLENMGIQPYLIASVLKGAIAQRLVRRYDNENQVYKGRSVVSETFTMNEDLENLIATGADYNTIRLFLKQQGMIFLDDDARSKIRAGITTVQEVQREISL